MLWGSLGVWRFLGFHYTPSAVLGQLGRTSVLWRLFEGPAVVYVKADLFVPKPKATWEATINYI